MTHNAERWSPSDELLDRFLAERAAPDERVAVEAWLARTPAGRRAADALRQLRFSAVESDTEQEELWQRIARRCQRAIEPSGVGHRRGEEAMQGGGGKGQTRPGSLFKAQPLRRTVWAPIATLVLGIVLTAIGWNVAMHHNRTSAATAMSVYTTGRGQRATITLPDGNTVALNVASHLEVPADYAAGDHTVRLVGEGLFDITHHDRTPFTVIAGSATTRVLGTRFVVRHYTADSTTIVAVQTGRVAIRSVVLTAAQQLEIPHSGVANVQVANPALYSFASGVLTLNGTRLSDAVPDLDRWYDADIRFGDSVTASQQITAGLPAGSLSDLSEYLELMFNVRVIRDGRVLTLLQR